MDCSNARLLLAFARPRANELPHSDAAELRHHLDTCTECATHAGGERRTDEHLGRAVRDVPLPTGLKNRLLDRLNRQRGLAHRRWAAAAAGLSVAAALLLGFALWAFLTGPPPVPVDIAVLGETVAVKTSNPTPEWVEQWFAQTHRVSLVAPRTFGQHQLDYTLLMDYDLVTLPNGRPAPKLLFVRGKERLVVYVLATRQFTPTGTEEESLGWTAQLHEAPEGPFNFLIFFTGRDLGLFCQRPPAG